MSIADQGRRVDQYLAVQPKPADFSILSILKERFDCLECDGCSRLVETVKLTRDIIETWRFDLRKLARPSILGVAHATCPICQELNSRFAKIFRQP